MEQTKRLFVDMDGTLARFHDETQYLERMFEKNFFRDLKPFADAVRGVKYFIQANPGTEVYILSAAVDGEPPYCKDEKNAWLDENLPEINAQHRIFTSMGANKADFIPGGITKTDILFDDYNKNLEEWQAEGGFAIKCKNNINHRGLVGKLWQGAVIDTSHNAFRIAIELSELTGSDKDAPMLNAYRQNDLAVRLESEIGTERVEELSEYFWSESQDAYTEEWRITLTDTEKQLVALWDNSADTLINNLTSGIAELEADPGMSMDMGW